MKDDLVVAYKFVEFIPEDLEEQTLYISIAYCTAVHKCCCGYGREVVTPLSPTAWKLIFDGKTVSLHPSIGNWSLPCRSHYFITNNKVVWAPRWTEKQIAKGRAREARARQRFYAPMQHPAVATEPIASTPETPKGNVKIRQKTNEESS